MIFSKFLIPAIKKAVLTLSIITIKTPKCCNAAVVTNAVSHCSGRVSSCWLGVKSEKVESELVVFFGQSILVVMF